jgi:hypothetical protein
MGIVDNKGHSNMEKHLYVYFDPLLGRQTIVGDSVTARIDVNIPEVCSESFTTEHGTYHYEPSHRDEVHAYLREKGVTIPVINEQ